MHHTMHVLDAPAHQGLLS